jgi:hypothetical protein
MAAGRPARRVPRSLCEASFFSPAERSGPVAAIKLKLRPGASRRPYRRQGREVAMRLRTGFLALAIVLAMACQASAATFRFGFQGSLNSLDPYTV